MEILNRIPLGTKTLIIIMVVLHILKVFFFDRSFFGYIVLNPALVIKEFQIWRLFTAQYFHVDIIHLLMNMSTFVQLGESFENTIGTLSFFYHIFVFGLLTNLTEIAIAAFMDFGGNSKPFYGSVVGFSGVLFSLMVIDNNVTGGAQRSVYGLFLVPSEIYPWIMLILVSMLMPKVSLIGHASGLIIGYLYQYKLIRWIIPSNNFFTKLEHGFCGCMSRISGFSSTENDHIHPEPYGLFNLLGRNRNSTENAGMENNADVGPFQGVPHSIAEPNDNTSSPFVGTPHTIGDPPTKPVEQLKWGETV